VLFDHRSNSHDKQANFETLAQNMDVAERLRTDRKRFFETEHLRDDLKGRSVRGGAATVLGQGAQVCIATASTMVMARLLTPRDYGMIAMITAVTGFIALFKDLGLSMATVREAQITHEQVSTLFWINVALSGVVMLVVMALAPVIVWFYGEPKLLPLTLVMSLGFVLSGLCGQHGALLRRQMQFGTLALIDILQLVVSVTVGIATALTGAGVWALVYMPLSGGLFNAVALWVVCRWRPSLPARRAGVQGMLVFGANLTGFNILNYFARNADNLIVGRFLGSGQLGLYSKAYALLMLPIQQITWPLSAVGIPALSHLQNDRERYRHYYYRAISAIAFATMPLVALLAALSEDIIRIVLGEQWVGASILFKVLAFAAFFQPVMGTAGWVYVSLGQTGRMFKWALISMPITVSSFIVGVFWGALGVAVSYTICYTVVLMVPTLWFTCRYSPVCVSGFFNALYRPAAVSLIMYAAVELLQTCFARYSPPIHGLVYSCLVALGVVALSVVCWPKLREEALDAIRVLKVH
jgi:O-antigen/teichoic acid export membrane protein